MLSRLQAEAHPGNRSQLLGIITINCLAFLNPHNSVPAWRVQTQSFYLDDAQPQPEGPECAEIERQKRGGREKELFVAVRDGIIVSESTGFSRPDFRLGSLAKLDPE